MYLIPSRPSKDRSFLTSSEVVVDGDDGESRKRIEYVKEGQKLCKRFFKPKKKRELLDFI